MAKSFRLLILTLIFSAFQAGYAQPKIAVAIATGKTPCKINTSDDLGYQVFKGSGNIGVLKTEASKKVKSDHPDSYGTRTEDNGFYGNRGNNVLIIETKMKFQGCDYYTYGVGFGNSKSEALADAKKNLRMRNWNWVEEKHGYREDFFRAY